MNSANVATNVAKTVNIQKHANRKKRDGNMDYNKKILITNRENDFTVLLSAQ